MDEAASLSAAAEVSLRSVEQALPHWETTSGNTREARPWEADLLRALGDLALAFHRLEEAAACLDRQVLVAPDVKPELWQTQLGEIDVVCVRDDLRLALAAASELHGRVDTWRAVASRDLA